MRVIVKLLILCFIITGCTFSRLNNELGVLEKSSIIQGTLKIDSVEDDTICVALLVQDNKILDYLNVANNHDYTFLVWNGAYKLYGFKDPNKNFRIDAGEKLVAGDDVLVEKVKSATVGSSYTGFNITRLVDERSQEYKSVKSLVSSIENTKNKLRYTQNGIITNLDNPVFSRDYASMGLWAPLSFINKIHPTIFMEEEYDPDKTPILFVHGALGSPADWKYINNRIDKSKVQSWFYYYPSGIPLKDSAKRLNKLVWELKKKFQFNDMVVMAHSMGGLVSRTFLVNDFGYPKKDFIRFHVTLSTPWNGHSAVELGLKYSPGIVPSWHDMKPDSPFIKENFSKEMPDGVEHFLLFGYKGGKGMFSRENTDGTVEMKSMLDERIQDKATLIYGFDEDHIGILNNKDVFDKIGQIIRKYYKKNAYR